MNGRYIKLYDSLLKSKIFKSPNLLKFWIWILLKASYADHEYLIGYQTVKLSRGQFIFGRKEAAEELNMSESSTYKLLKKIEVAGMISVLSTNRFSVVTVINWDKYQLNSEPKENSNNRTSKKDEKSNNRTSDENMKSNNRNNLENLDIITSTTTLFENNNNKITAESESGNNKITTEPEKSNTFKKVLKESKDVVLSLSHAREDVPSTFAQTNQVEEVPSNPLQDRSVQVVPSEHEQRKNAQVVPSEREQKPVQVVPSERESNDPAWEVPSDPKPIPSQRERSNIDILYEQIGNHYTTLTGRFVDALDFGEIQKIVDKTTDISVIRAAMDQASERYVPRFEGDRIRSFKYFTPVVLRVISTSDNGNGDTDYEAVKELYNKTCPSLPVVTEMTDERKRLIKALLSKISIEKLKQVFLKAEQSDFLTGKVKNYRASFDFLINADNAFKVLEGNYDNREPTNTTGGYERNTRSANRFVNFEQRDMDFKELERQEQEYIKRELENKYKLGVWL